MMKKVGALGLMLTAGLLFVQPSVAQAQERYGSDSYYRTDRTHDRDYRRYGHQGFREEREVRKWREREIRERERWERRNYRDSRNAYRNERDTNYGYGYGYTDPYRPY
jgi:hypothetical protein